MPRKVKLAAPRTTIVVAGAWNLAIFTPEWVSQRMDGDLTIELAITDVAPTFIFRSSTVALTLAPGRFTLLTRDGTVGAMQAAEDVACKVLADLPHTPVRAFGINLVVSSVDGKIQQITQTADLPALGRFGQTATSIHHVVELGGGQRLNLAVSSSEIALNFHRDTADAEQAGAALRGAVASNTKFARKLLAEVYDLDLELGEQ